MAEHDPTLNQDHVRQIADKLLKVGTHAKDQPVTAEKVLLTVIQELVGILVGIREKEKARARA